MLAKSASAGTDTLFRCVVCHQVSEQRPIQHVLAVQFSKYTRAWSPQAFEHVQPTSCHNSNHPVAVCGPSAAPTHVSNSYTPTVDSQIASFRSFVSSCVCRPGFPYQSSHDISPPPLESPWSQYNTEKAIPSTLPACNPKLWRGQ